MPRFFSADVHGFQLMKFVVKQPHIQAQIDKTVSDHEDFSSSPSALKLPVISSIPSLSIFSNRASSAA